MATIKKLLLVYDKPMIYHPLGTMMFAGIREILIISTQEDALKFETILGDRKHLGLSFTYKFREN
jgi:glucose-1-phosphate thymidylyltransferase